MSLNTLLGRRFTRSFQVSKDKVQEYLTVLNEGNPYYQSIRQSTAFDLVVPPGFVVVYLYQVVTKLFAHPAFTPARCILHGEQKVEFVNPVKVGDTIDTTMTIESVTTTDSRRRRSQEMMELHFVSWNQRKEVVSRATTILFLWENTGDE